MHWLTLTIALCTPNFIKQLLFSAKLNKVCVIYIIYSLYVISREPNNLRQNRLKNECHVKSKGKFTISRKCTVCYKEMDDFLKKLITHFICNSLLKEILLLFLNFIFIYWDLNSPYVNSNPYKKYSLCIGLIYILVLLTLAIRIFTCVLSFFKKDCC